MEVPIHSLAQDTYRMNNNYYYCYSFVGYLITDFSPAALSCRSTCALPTSARASPCCPEAGTDPPSRACACRHCSCLPAAVPCCPGLTAASGRRPLFLVSVPTCLLNRTTSTTLPRPRGLLCRRVLGVNGI